MYIVKEIPYDKVNCVQIDDTMEYVFPECIIAGNKNLYPYNSDLLKGYNLGLYSPEEITELLFDITGKRYKFSTIRGSVQSEWNYLFYPETIDTDFPFVHQITDKDIRIIESEYFNTGSEWNVFDTETEEQYNVYIHDPDPDEKTIANYLLCIPEEMEIHHFKGYKNIAVYD